MSKTFLYQGSANSAKTIVDRMPLNSGISKNFNEYETIHNIFPSYWSLWL